VRGSFRITVKGRLSGRFAAAFEGVTPEAGAGETVLVGSLDQAELYGLLARLSEFGLELVRVEEVSE
jgi:hypothetical protein